jgi:hypothetical protein
MEANFWNSRPDKYLFLFIFQMDVHHLNSPITHKAFLMHTFMSGTLDSFPMLFSSNQEPKLTTGTDLLYGRADWEIPFLKTRNDKK